MFLALGKMYKILKFLNQNYETNASGRLWRSNATIVSQTKNKINKIQSKLLLENHYLIAYKLAIF